MTRDEPIRYARCTASHRWLISVAAGSLLPVILVSSFIVRADGDLRLAILGGMVAMVAVTALLQAWITSVKLYAAHFVFRNAFGRPSIVAYQDILRISRNARHTDFQITDGRRVRVPGDIEAYDEVIAFIMAKAGLTPDSREPDAGT